MGWTAAEATATVSSSNQPALPTPTAATKDAPTYIEVATGATSTTAPTGVEFPKPVPLAPQRGLEPSQLPSGATYGFEDPTGKYLAYVTKHQIGRAHV